MLVQIAECQQRRAALRLTDPGARFSHLRAEARQPLSQLVVQIACQSPATHKLSASTRRSSNWTMHAGCKRWNSSSRSELRGDRRPLEHYARQRSDT